MGNVYQWLFIVLVVGIILTSSILPELIVGITILLTILTDMYSIRISILQGRIKLEQKGLELSQIIPSTLVIFGWLIYVVVHFQIFLSLVYYLELPSVALKWVFPLTALKALWPVYYLGSKLPEKKQLNYSSNPIVFQIPWAVGGAFVWYNSNSTEIFNWSSALFAFFILFISLTPSFYGLWIKRRS